MEPAARGTEPRPTPPPRSAWTRWGRDLAWFALIVLAGLVLRVIYIQQLQSYPFYADPVMDPRYHHDWAVALVEGREAQFINGPYFRAPLYPWFLGGLYWLWGSDSTTPARLVQAVLGSLSCGLIFLLGRVAFNRSVGVLAGLTAASYWMLLYYDAELLLEGLQNFLTLILLLLLMLVQDKRRPLLWFAIGIVLGLIAITRPNILLFAPVVVLWIIWLHGRNLRRSAAYSALTFVGCLLPIVPITVRNYVVGKDVVLIAAQGGVNFYIGNNPKSDGMSAVIPGDPLEWWPCYLAQVERAEREMGRKLKPSEVSRYYAGKAWGFIFGSPRESLALLGKKLRYFWSYWEVSNNQDIRFVTSRFTPIVRALPITFAIVGPLGVLGLVLCLGRARALFPLWSYVLVYMTSIVAFFVTARYRIPVVIVLIPLAAYAVAWFARTIRQRGWGRLVPAAAVLAAMGYVTAQRPRGVDVLMVQGFRSVGLYYAQQQRYADARPYLEQAAQRADQCGFALDAQTWFALGVARTPPPTSTATAPAADLEGSLAAFRRAIAADPLFPNARENIFRLLRLLGRDEEALDELRRWAAIEPKSDLVQVRLAQHLFRRGEDAEGAGRLLAAVALNSAHWSAVAGVLADLLAREEKERADRLLALLAQHAPEPAAQTLVAAAQQRIREKRLPDALRLLAAASPHFAANVPIHALLIQLLISVPDETLRDVPQAVQLGEMMCAATQHDNPTILLATAQAYAAAGRFDDARLTATEARDLGQQRGLETVVQEAQRLLAHLDAQGTP